jgi:hypothetical protein
MMRASSGLVQTRIKLTYAIYALEPLNNEHY